MDALTEKLLSIPVGPTQAPRQLNPDKDFTRQIEVVGETATLTVRDEPGTITDDTAIQYIREEGLNPDEWEATGFTKSVWGDPPKESVKFTYKRREGAGLERPNIDELIAVMERAERAPYVVDAKGYGAIVGIGDMQFGKIDGDGVDGTLRRTVEYIDKAAQQIDYMAGLWPVDHIHVAWLGDHIEGFNSQGGANVWRTPLTLNEQIRLTRRVMTHAMVTFGELGVRLSMAAVPGNHGEPQRFMDKGVTRYDDSHDTESLIAVSEAAALTELYNDVEFYVPATDEMTVVVDVAGTTVAHAHGHQWRPTKHFDWWKGQAFNPSSAMHMADVLMAGHLHHEHQEADGHRLFIGVPSLESESTWFRHSTGTAGNPGIFLGITKDKRFVHKSIVQ